MRLIYGFDPHAVQKTGPQPPHAPVTVRDLAAIGIPPRKIPRVREELDRLAAADPALRDPALLLKLARRLARRLL